MPVLYPDVQPRRSARLTTYQSNGRDYLTNTIGWSRSRFEAWITSPTVRPHLQLWYRSCIDAEHRFNDAVEWINSGSNGYFYNPADLEEDLLLLCMGEGIDELANDKAVVVEGTFSDDYCITRDWNTQELWARTAWRIVRDNAGGDRAFGDAIAKHPSACFAWLIVGSSWKQKKVWERGRKAWFREHGEKDAPLEPEVEQQTPSEVETSSCISVYKVSNQAIECSSSFVMSDKEVNEGEKVEDKSMTDVTQGMSKSEMVELWLNSSHNLDTEAPFGNLAAADLLVHTHCNASSISSTSPSADDTEATTIQLHHPAPDATVGSSNRGDVQMERKTEQYGVGDDLLFPTPKTMIEHVDARASRGEW